MAEPQQPILAVRGLSFTYPDGTPAVDDVSFTVAPGERVAIVGPNGAGKSTLLLLLTGILSGRGSIEVCGLPLEKKNLKLIRQHVGLVFQNPDDQLFCPTVFDDVAFGPRNLGLDETEVRRRVRQSLDAVGFADHAHGDGVIHRHTGALTGERLERKSAFHLSMGQKKRVAIATVLALDARILVFDEPTSSLDPRGRREIGELLAHLGGTQLIVTHDLGLVRNLCNRVIVLSASRIAAEGRPDELLADPVLLERHHLL